MTILQITLDAIEIALLNANEYSPDDDEQLTVLRLSDDTYLAVTIAPAQDANDVTTVCNYTVTFSPMHDAPNVERIFLSHLMP